MKTNIEIEKRFKELADRSYSENRYVFTDFLDMLQLSAFYAIERELSFAGLTVFGGIDGCERCMVRFGSIDNCGYDESFPITLLHVSPLQKKFAETLTHRDFLGSVIGLGIERTKLGDIFVKENECYIFVADSIGEYILENLSSVKHTSVKVQVCESIPDSITPEISEESIIVSSNRLDAIIARVYKLSRDMAIKVISEGKVFVNGREMTGASEGVGQWLQVAVLNDGKNEYYYDDFVDRDKTESAPIKIYLSAGENTIRLMNHRRQENTLTSYAKIQEELNRIAPDNDIVFSICEWGKTQPQNWGYKVGDSWRILNDITFQVGSDGDSGHAVWEGAYTTSVTAQYNKAVIMDEFSGLDKGWNDPDMLMIGMNGLTETMCKTHMTMWCMINSPLMLGMDLRNVEKGDSIYSIISNEDAIALNQDALGVQAKRIFTTKAVLPDKTYIRDNDRMDVLAKPLADGSLALSFINVGMGERSDELSISKELIRDYIGDKMVQIDKFFKADEYEITDIWSKEKKTVRTEAFSNKVFGAKSLEGCDNLTIKITPVG